MELPENPNFPYFAYGLFKPNELAFNKISKFLDGQPESLRVTNCCLWIRDGLPLIQVKSKGVVKGVSLKFRENDRKDAYSTISDFLSIGQESPYKWDVINLKREESEDPIKMNVLIGRNLGKGSKKTRLPAWCAKEDPMFTEAMDKIKGKIKKFAKIEFDREHFEWDRFFELEMAYLLLWVAIERYCSFAYGPLLAPTEKITTLSYEASFQTALKKILNKSERVNKVPELYDYRYIDKSSLKAVANKPTSSIKYYYRARSNLVHRGKSEWVDGEIIRFSLKNLYEIFSIVLSETLFNH
jgi:hypothetical protein